MLNLNDHYAPNGPLPRPQRHHRTEPWTHHRTLDSVTPLVLRPKQITKPYHEHHVYVIMYVTECVDSIFVTSDDQ